MRQFVTPGEELPKDARRNEYVMLQNGKAYSNILGFYDSDKKDVIPLEGMWKPRIGDNVIGVVEKPSKPGLYNVALTEFVQGLIITSKFDSGPVFEANDIIEATVLIAFMASSVLPPFIHIIPFLPIIILLPVSLAI